MTSVIQEYGGDRCRGRGQLGASYGPTGLLGPEDALPGAGPVRYGLAVTFDAGG